MEAPRAEGSPFPGDHLDLARGIAALAVAAWHWRNLFFVDYPQVADKGLLAQALYVATGFGHEAVMVFFVLSGYFIGASVLRDWRADRFSWHAYLVNRVSRLWIVLVPALVLGGALDWIGYHHFGPHTPYHNQFWAFPGIFVLWDVKSTLTGAAFFGNMLFVQTIIVPWLGSNSPLWSLANEFWYYVLFPLGLFALGGRAPWPRRLLFGAILAGLAVFVGRNVVAYFVIWLFGAAVAAARPLPWVARPWYRPVALGLGATIIALALLLCRQAGTDSFPHDVFLGFACAIGLYAVLTAARPSPRPWYRAIAHGLAGFSYSLYALHAPAFLFLAVAIHAGQRWQPDLPHMAMAGGPFLAVVAYAWGVAKLTEAHTGTIRRFLLRDHQARPQDSSAV